jgi:hypothetical protein
MDRSALLSVPARRTRRMCSSGRRGSTVEPAEDAVVRGGVRAATVAAAVAAVAAGSAVAISTAGTASAALSTVDWKPCPDKPEVDCGR